MRGGKILKNIARKNDKGETQSFKDHTLEVMNECERDGKKLGMSNITIVMTATHDFGKLSPDWQDYIRDNNRKEKLDHATWGAKFLIERYYETNHPDKLYRVCLKFVIESIAKAICGHHGQLSDGIDLNGESPFVKRLLKEEIQPNSIIPIFEKEIMHLSKLDEHVHLATLEYIEIVKCVQSKLNKDIDPIERMRACFSPLFTNHLYSILVDNDRKNAREWLYGKSKPMPSLLQQSFLSQLQKNLNDYLDELNRNAKPTKINQLRRQISDESEKSGEEKTGIYRLATPVGAGKTIASLRFALKHAKVHKKERIIYVLPLTAIIEQNAEEVRNILKAEDWLLEDHGQVILEKDNDKSPYSLSIAKDSWDAPIIFTTMYQYLMTFYGGAGRYLRRLHHLTNSIIIFDEIQSAPPESVSLFNESLNYLYEVGNSTILLCTATQPTLNKIKHGIRHDIKPIVKNEMMLAKSFKRMNIRYIPQLMTTKRLGTFVKEKMNDFNSFLVILNTKSVVKKLFKTLKRKNLNIPIYHLSTDMCPKHRTDILNKVKEHLTKKEKVICISTPLIEAGVNISFESVVRSITSLYSIAQASGRGNRHGELDMGEMYLIHHIEEQLDMLPTVQIGRKITLDMLNLEMLGKQQWSGDIISPEAMEYFFNRYFKRIQETLDYPIDVNGKRKVKLFNLLFKNHKMKHHYSPPEIQHGLNKSPINHFLSQSQYPFLNYSAYRTVFEHYKVYKDEQITVVVPYKQEGMDWIRKIETSNLKSSWQKDILPYTINLYKEKLEKLLTKGIVQKIEIEQDQFVFVLNNQSYDLNFGLID